MVYEIGLQLHIDRRLLDHCTAQASSPLWWRHPSCLMRVKFCDTVSVFFS